MIPRKALYRATAPSNIALLKYWGKQPGYEQWPTNPSLSMTLSDLCTRSEAERHDGVDHQLLLNGRAYTRSEASAHKIFAHLDRLMALTNCTEKLTITTSNSFPTACGIASSASGFAALTLAGLGACLDAASLRELAAKGWSRERLADLARRGSGSACRSMWGGFVEWLPGARVEQQECRQIFGAEHWDLADTVLLVSSAEKSCSSSAGHEHAWSSPLFKPRLAGMAEKLERCRAALRGRSMAALGPFLEQEALEMHGVMMTATPRTIYLGAETVEVLTWLRQQRQQEPGLELYFTLDAGPNVHIIGEYSHQQRLHQLLNQRFPHLTFRGDRVGAGPLLERL